MLKNGLFSPYRLPRPDLKIGNPKLYQHVSQGVKV